MVHTKLQKYSILHALSTRLYRLCPTKAMRLYAKSTAITQQ